MEVLPSDLLNLLFISVTVSVVNMVVVQKFKDLPFISKDWQVWILNFVFAFAIGIPFSLTFYSLDIISSIWVAMFTFVGAPTLFDALKNQNLINYKPNSLDNDSSTSEEEDSVNEIIRE